MARARRASVGAFHEGREISEAGKRRESDARIHLRRGMAMLGIAVLALLMIGGGGALAAVRDGVWQHQGDLNAPRETLPLGLGSCVSASTDGLLAVGGGIDRDVGMDAGSVTLWQTAVPSRADSGSGAAAGPRSLAAVIPHPKGSTSSGFGMSVALDPRGRLLCVGAPYEAGGLAWPEGFQVGRVYIYELDRRGPQLEWQLAAVLASPADGLPGSAGGHFGASIATDGIHVVVGSPDDSAQAFAAGRCDVFTRGTEGWKHAAHFPSPTGEMTGRFGRSVAVDGDFIVVGWSQGDGSFPDQGRTDLYRLSRQSTRTGWHHGAVLQSPAPTQGGMFGASVGIDGDLIAVGAPREWTTQVDRDRSGQVHLWRLNRTGAIRLRLEASIAPPRSICRAVGEVRPEAFGMSLALRGSLLAVGATEACALDETEHEPAVLEGCGCIHVLERSNGIWTATARLQSPQPTPEAHDGWGVAIGAQRHPWIAAARLGDLERSAGPGRVLIFSPTRRLEEVTAAGESNR